MCISPVREKGAQPQQKKTIVLWNFIFSYWEVWYFRYAQGRLSHLGKGGIFPTEKKHVFREISFLAIVKFDISAVLVRGGTSPACVN